MINGLIEDGVLRAYMSPNRGNIIGDCKDDAGYWAGFYFWALLMEYNTSRLKEEEVPKSWSELNDAKWKGKVVVADPNKSASGLGFVKGMVKLESWDWIVQLAENGRSRADLRSGRAPVGAQGRAPRGVPRSAHSTRRPASRAVRSPWRWRRSCSWRRR